MNIKKHPVRKEVERNDESGRKAYDFWLCFIKSLVKTLLTNHQQISGEKNMENIAKGSENGAEKIPTKWNLKDIKVSQGTSPKTLLGTGSKNI